MFHSGNFRLLLAVAGAGLCLILVSSFVDDSGNTVMRASVEDAWFEESWARGLTVPYQHQFVGDKPLFPPCKHGKKADKRLAISVIETPQNLLRTCKNPCWFDTSGLARKLRCLPYFYIPAIAKAGTTDLFRRIRMHPDVMMGTMKEYHFWDEMRFGNVHDIWDSNPYVVSNEVHWTLEDYTDKITGKDGIQAVLQDLRANGTSPKIFGDGSPSYMRATNSWPILEGNEGCSEPRVLTGHHIRHATPSAKLILIFRHPTTRLFSRFASRTTRTPMLKEATNEDFHNYVVKGVQLYEDCFKRFSLRQCAYNNTLRVEAVVRLNEGLYPVYLADWLRIWPKEQMLFLRNEDYGRDLSGTLDTVFQFLTLAPVRGPVRDEIMSHELYNPGTVEYSKLGPMKPETKAVLDQFYQPFVVKMAELLQDDRYLWRDVYHSSADKL